MISLILFESKEVKLKEKKKGKLIKAESRRQNPGPGGGVVT